MHGNNHSGIGGNNHSGMSGNNRPESASTTASIGARGVYSVLVHMLKVPVIALFAKLLLFDLGHWIPRYKQFIKFMRNKFSGEQESPVDAS
jgi:hypothetical protein